MSTNSGRSASSISPARSIMRQRFSNIARRLSRNQLQEAIVDNALSFIEKGGAELWDNALSQRDRAKYSSIHLFEGIELLLKAVLIKEHWFIAVRGRCTQDEFARGDFDSVGLKEILERLCDVCGIVLPRRTCAAFELLRDLRNQFVHFRCSAALADIIATQWQAWEELQALVSARLVPLSSIQSSQLSRIKTSMEKQQSFVNGRFAAMKDTLDGERKQSTLVVCPRCGKEALSLRHQVLGLGHQQNAPMAHTASSEPAETQTVNQKQARRSRRQHHPRAVQEHRLRDDKAHPSPQSGPYCFVCERHYDSSAILTEEWLDAFVPPSARQRGYCTKCHHETVVPLARTDTSRKPSDYVCLQCGELWQPGARGICEECGGLVFGDVSLCGCHQYDDYWPDENYQDQAEEPGEDYDDPYYEGYQH